MKNLKYLISALGLLCACYVFTHCGKEEIVDDPIIDPIINDSTTSGLSLSKQRFSGMEYALISSSTRLNNHVYKGKINEQVVPVQWVADDKLALLIPNLASGDYLLTVDGFSETFNIQIAQTPEQADPEQTLMDFVGDFNSELDQLIAQLQHQDSIGIAPYASADLAELSEAKDSMATALGKWSGLSTDEKQKIAQFIIANANNVNELDRILDGVYADGGFKRGVCSGGDDWSRATCLVGEMMFGVTYMVAPAVIGAIVGGELSAGFGTAAGAVIGTMIFRSKVIAGRTRFKIAFVELVNWSFVPVDKVEAEVDALKQTFAFENGVEKQLNFSFETRTVDRSKDESDAALGVFFQLLDAVNYINEKIIKRPTFAIPPIKTVKYTPKDLSLIQIDYLSNPLINGEVLTKSNQLYLRFVTNEITNQTMRFKLSLAYGNRVIRSAQIDGTLKIAEFNKVGSWYGEVYSRTDNTLLAEHKFDIVTNSGSNAINHYIRQPGGGWETYSPGRYYMSFERNPDLLSINHNFLNNELHVFPVNAWDDKVFYSNPNQLQTVWWKLTRQ